MAVASEGRCQARAECALRGGRALRRRSWSCPRRPCRRRTGTSNPCPRRGISLSCCWQTPLPSAERWPPPPVAQAARSQSPSCGVCVPEPSPHVTHRLHAVAKLRAHRPPRAAPSGAFALLRIHLGCFATTIAAAFSARDFDRMVARRQGGIAPPKLPKVGVVAPRHILLPCAYADGRGDDRSVLVSRCLAREGWVG
jgi:hypothetical protein